jgi:WD40 repeat protein
MAAGIRDRWGAYRQTLEGHGHWVKAVAFSPDGSTLASASYDWTIRFWDTATGAHRQTLKGHVYVSDSFERLTGYKQHEILGRNLVP